MAVRSARLFGPQTCPQGSVTTVYVVPAGRTAVFRMLTVVVPGAAAGNIRLFVNGQADINIVWRGPVAAVSTVEVLDGLVLNPGDQLRVHPGAIDAVVTGAGSLLLGAPE